MKKNVIKGCIVAALFFVGTATQAQTYAEVEKADSGTPWSIETNITAGQNGINWNAPALRARYFIDDNWAVRLQLGLGDGSGNPMKSTEYFYENSDGTGGEGTVNISRAAVTAQLGAEYHFLGTKKLDPYAALGINFGGGTQKTVGTSTNGSIYNDAVKFDGKGGFSVIGGTLGLGADFYFVENVYLGMELGFGINALNHKDSESVTEVNMGGGTTVVTTNVTPGYKEAYMSTQATLRLGWRF